jgi:hypothetical protein
MTWNIARLGARGALGGSERRLRIVGGERALQAGIRR